MTGGRRTDERASASLAALVLDRFGARVDLEEPGWAGEESVGWRAATEDGDVFVQRFPQWRSTDELVWCDSVARAASSHASEVVCARSAIDGRVAIETDEGHVCVFPFVEGTHPDDDREVADAAAELLARIHLGLAESWTRDARRQRRDDRAGTDELPPILVDPELDLLERDVAMGPAPKLPVHGDFYTGNLITDGDNFVGVIDWLEARVEHQVQEVNWAAWEFCQNEAGDDLVDDDARAFLAAYAAADGPADVQPGATIVPWIRQRLRREASVALREADGRPLDSTYHEGQIRAFHTLRGRHLVG